MEEDSSGRKRAANPFTRDILMYLAITIALLAAAWVLYRVLHLDLPRMVVAPVLAYPFYNFMMSVRRFFNYRSYVRDIRGGRPMKKEDYLKEMAAVDRQLGKQRSDLNNRK